MINPQTGNEFFEKTGVGFFGSDQIRSVWVWTVKEELRSETLQDTLSVRVCVGGCQHSMINIGPYELCLSPREINSSVSETTESACIIVIIDIIISIQQ